MAHGADGSEGAPRSLDYRPDIDGLRAVAVLAVLAYHLDAGVLPGGFIGVDVFFVISGFLITSILWREAREGRLSVAEFYRRRVLRIFPALFFLLAVVGLLGIALLTPPELADLGRSAAAASWSVANLFFYAGTDYFARDARATWLLHTWSLGVEEQFYLVLPLLVAACGPRRRRLAATVGTLAAVSFLGSTVTAFSAPAAAFYLPHSRAWELFAGSLLALGVLRVPPRRAVRETAAGTGLVLIAAACLALSKRTPFPGAGALLPCAGAVLLIGSGPETAAARLLSLRPMVFVGLISYSVYLWHWPLLVLSRHPAVELPAPLDHTAPRLAALALASLALGALSWRFVEIPLRRPRFGRNPVQVLAVAACVALAVGLGSLAVALAEGLPGRFGPEAAVWPIARGGSTPPTTGPVAASSPRAIGRRISTSTPVFAPRGPKGACCSSGTATPPTCTRACTRRWAFPCSRPPRVDAGRRSRSAARPGAWRSSAGRWRHSRPARARAGR